MTTDVRFLPAPRLSSEVAHRIVELAEHRILTPARSAGVELQFIGISHPPVHEQEYKLDSGIWKFVDHVDDPTAREFRGRIPVPVEQIARLKYLGSIGVCPQHIWIGHQMPPDYQPDDPPPRLVPPPRELREKDERLRLGLAAALRLFIKGAGLTLGAAAVVPGMAVSAVASVGLDPVIFGGVEHPELPLFAWCALAQWEWE